MVLEEKAIGQAGPAVPGPGLRLRAALALPLMTIAVYLAFYVSGLWSLGSVQLAPRILYAGPFPFLASATIISFGMSWYAAARPPAVLAGAAVLFVLLSLISIGQSAATQQLFPLIIRIIPLLLTYVLLMASVLASAVVMLVVRTVAPALRRPSYWLVALILWPFISFLTSTLVPILVVNWHLAPSSMPHLAFAVLLVRQCIIFGWIGHWLDRDNRQRNAIGLAFG